MFVLKPMLFGMYINKINEIECTLSTVADDTKVSGSVDTLKGRDAIQGGHERLEELQAA